MFDAKVEASFREAIRTAKKQKSVSLEKRGEASNAEYRRRKEVALTLLPCSSIGVGHLGALELRVPLTNLESPLLTISLLQKILFGDYRLPVFRLACLPSPAAPNIKSVATLY
jgi:hypothetical protein